MFSFWNVKLAQTDTTFELNSVEMKEDVEEMLTRPIRIDEELFWRDRWQPLMRMKRGTKRGTTTVCVYTPGNVRTFIPGLQGYTIAPRTRALSGAGFKHYCPNECL